MRTAALFGTVLLLSPLIVRPAAGAPADGPGPAGPIPRFRTAGGADPLRPGTYRWSGHDVTADSAGIAGRLVRLEVGLGAGPYSIEIDLAPISGTVDVILNDEAIASQLDASTAPSIRGDFEQTGSDARMELLLKANAGQRAGARSVTLFPRSEQPLRQVALPRLPGPDTTMSARDGVRACCDYLVRYQISDGTYDDRDRSWAHAAYCVRALLAGYEIHMDERYLEAARRTMSTFVGEQYPDGGWCADARSRDPGSPCERRSIADLGVMVTCLPLVSTFVEPQAVMVYLNAHGSFLDGTLARFDDEAGGYRDQDPADADRATATQAMSMTALFQATADSTYLRRAESAIWALVFAWDRILTAGPGPPASLLPYLDAMCWVHRATADPVLRGRVEETLRRTLYAERGLLDRIADDTGWLPAEAGPEGNALLAVLIETRRILGDSARVERAIAAGTKALAAPAVRVRHGVLAFPYADPDSVPPSGWDSAVLSTAMAGLSFAQSAAPGVIFRRR